MKKRSLKENTVDKTNFYSDQTTIQQYEKLLKMTRREGYKEGTTRAYLGIGKIYRSENQNQIAIQYHQKALEIASGHGYEHLESQAHLELGEDYRSGNELHMAIQHNKKALKIASEKGYKNEEIQAHNELGKAYRFTNQSKVAIKHHKEVLKIAREQGYKNEETQAHIELGDTSRFDNQNETAIKHYKKALEIAGEKENELLTTQAYIEHVHRLDNQNQTAIQHCEEVLQIAREQKCKLLETQAYLGFGEVYKSFSQNRKAIEYFKRAWQIANEHGHEIEEIQACLSSGEAYVSDNQHEKAIDCYEKALEIAGKQGCKLQKTIAHLLLGEAYRSGSQNQKAIKQYEIALKIAEEQGYTGREIQAHFHLGETYKSKNDVQTASEHYRKAFAIAKAHGDEKFKHNAIKELSKLTEHLQISRHSFRTHGQYEEATESYQPSAQIANETDQNKNQARTSEYEKAIECYQKPRNISPDVETSRLEVIASRWLDYNHCQYEQHVPVQIGLGMCYASLKRFEEALTCFRKALDCHHSEKAFEGIINEWFRHCCRLIKGNNQKTRELYKSSIKIAEQFGRKYQQSCLNLASTCSKDWDYEMAKEWYERLLDILGAESNHDPLREKVFVGLALTFFNLGDTEKALGTIEKAKTFAKKETRTVGYGAPYTVDPTRINVADTEENLREPNATTSLVQLEDANNVENLNNSADQISSPTHIQEDPVSWQWIKKSIVHRERLMKLYEYAKHHPDKIQDINGVRVCCSREFCVGKGSEGTRVYVGLGKDGLEKAVKRLPRDACADFAEQEKKVLNELNAMKSNYVVKYWFLEEQNDGEYLFLILDLCEETLESFVKRSNLVVKSAPNIIQQILKGLVDLHRGPKPILHRNLKPSNILRDVENNWLLADFGISRIMAVGARTHLTKFSGTEDWMADEFYFSKGLTDDDKSGEVRYKKESDIQVAGMVAFYILTQGEHPFGAKPDRLRNLLHGKPVGLNMLKDDAAKDLICWMLSHDPKDRPSAEMALKHPYLQSQEQQFELLCKVGNQPEIKTQDVKSDVVQKLNSDPEDWRNRIAADVFTYLSTDSLKGRTTFYKPSWTDCLRLIRNVKQHWHDRPRPRPEAFYIVENPQKYFLNLFPSLCVEIHKIIRSCNWKERDDLKRYFA